MGVRFSRLITAEVEPGVVQLYKELSFLDKKFGEIVARKSFVSDKASIKILRKVGLLWLYALLVGYGDKSAILHDWLYSGYGIKDRAKNKTYYPTRKECDEIYYRALRAEGVARWRAYIFYVGVRVGGKSSYTQKAVWNESSLVE